MPMDGLTLGFAAREINAALATGRIDKVTQPEKDMLLLGVRAGGQNHKLLLSASPSFARAHLTAQTFVNPADAPMFCMLMRKYLLGGRFISCEQLFGDRIMKIVIENADELGEIAPRELYFEAMGRHSNLTLVVKGRIIDAIRHVTDDMSRVRQALPGLDYELPPKQDKCDPFAAKKEELAERLNAQTGRLDKALSSVISGLSGVAAKEIALRISGSDKTQMQDINIEETAARLHDFLQKIPSLTPPVVLYDQGALALDVFPYPYLSYPEGAQTPCPTLSAALDMFYAGRDLRDRMAQKGVSLRKLIKTHIERDEKKLALQIEELTASERMEEYRVCGELLTANLHAVSRTADSVTVYNYYDNSQLTITLDKKYSPAQNAQRYYKKYQKARAAQKTAAEQKAKTKSELEVLESALDDLSKCETEDDLSDIRKILTDADILKKTVQKKGGRKPIVSKPYEFISSDGFAVSVGKNSVQNDRLTQSARGNDIWLHAKDMPASHVIIHAEDKDVPDTTILEAARLAAWFCKARGGSNVPIDYTYRKYVKKPGGAPLGFVIYTNQKTLYITVSDSDIRKIKTADGKTAVV